MEEEGKAKFGVLVLEEVGDLNSVKIYIVEVDAAGKSLRHQLFQARKAVLGRGEVICFFDGDGVGYLHGAPKRII